MVVSHSAAPTVYSQCYRYKDSRVTECLHTFYTAETVISREPCMATLESIICAAVTP